MTLPLGFGGIDEFLNLVGSDMAAVTEQAAAGQITITQWELEMQRLVRVAHNGADILARGGRELGFFERIFDWFRRQGEVRRQFDYLRAFAEEIRAGTFDPESLLPRVEARARMYANAARATYEQGRAREAGRRGYTEKRRILAPAEHCPDCIEQAQLDWVDINDPRVTGVADGSTRCLTNCKCSIEYR